MELTVQKSNFLKALVHANSVVEKRTTIPVLSHVLLSATQAGLTLTTTDLDMGLVETIPAHVKIAGRICVPAQLLHDIIKKLPDLPIEISINYDTHQLLLKSGRASFKLPALAPEDFPEITQTVLTHNFNISKKDLCYMIDHTRFAMSTDETRYHLNGIYLHLHNENSQTQLRAVASDLHRLACVSINAPEDTENLPQMIIGRKAIQEIRKLLEEADELVHVGASENRFELRVENSGLSINFSTRLVDGQFPEYTATLDSVTENTVTVNTKSLAEAADRIITVITDRDRAMSINLADKQATLSGASQEYGTAQEEVDIEYHRSEPMQLCFNARYVFDIANLIKDENINMFVNSPDNPVVIRPANNNSEIYAIMPLFA
jgi:DNA polymerase-3 subunit beta